MPSLNTEKKLAQMPKYTFTQDEAQTAYDEWGCNCGPTALAFALQTTLEKVHPLLPGFDSKRYTNPSMMKRALEMANRRFRSVQLPVSTQMFDELALVRIQWTGPWTAQGARPRWAYRQTHWITTWSDCGSPWLFDCNGGVQSFPLWEKTIVPLLTGAIERADGGWYPTHIWRLSRQC